MLQFYFCSKDKDDENQDNYDQDDQDDQDDQKEYDGIKINELVRIRVLLIIHFLYFN